MTKQEDLVKQYAKEENIESRNRIIEILAQKQTEERKINKSWNKFIFEWESVTNESIEITKNTPISMWLCPIKFNIDLAIIIEAIQRKISSILVNRNEEFERIYLSLNIEKENFYTKIEQIQNLLIQFGKVKVCSNGTVILMNEIMF